MMEKAKAKTSLPGADEDFSAFTGRPSFQGFDSKHHALQFEDVFKSNPSYGLHERLKLSEDLCHQAKYHDVRMC